MAENLETYLFTNVGALRVPPALAAKINAAPRRKRDRQWDMRYTAGRRASDWFDLVDYLACEHWARGEQLDTFVLPDFTLAA